MYIKRITVQNIKSFREETCFELGAGVNYFVGDNNSGKSTVMESLLFLFEGPTATRWRPETFYSKNKVGPARVEVDLTGNLEELVLTEKFKVFKDYVFEFQGDKILRLERNSETRTVVQNGKEKTIDFKAVCCWHPVREQFENVTGIDARVKSLFDFEAIWADAQPGDHIDFSNTKTLGRLLDSAFKRFTLTERWSALTKAHEEAFTSEESDSFFAETEKLADGIKALVDEQYGNASYRFEFALPDTLTFMKQGTLQVDDGAGETPVEGKGTGMQRAIALGLIQLYARSSAMEEDAGLAPLILLLDEPETWLHPSAQLRLGDALNRIGEHEQVFIVTHSPYLIRKFDTESHRLTVITGNGELRRIDDSSKFGLFGAGEPSWGEINYRAFGICSHEFHNELYGCVQSFIEKSMAEDKYASVTKIDDFLLGQQFTDKIIWKKSNVYEQKVTLSSYVRNSIHHPENMLNAPVTSDDLLESTRYLISAVEKLSQSENLTELN